MRGLEVVLFMLAIVIGIPLAGVLLPSSNGVDVGANDITQVTNPFNWTKMQDYQLKDDPSFLDQAGYYFDMAVMAITGVAAILFSGVTTAPALLSIFAVNPTLNGILLSALAIILILAWLQIAKGDDWSGKR